MDLTHRFTVPATIDDTWAAFNDLERIAPCFPGAALTSYDGEQFEGLVKVKLGPISLQYTGTGRFVERDEGAKRALIEAKGKDKRGNGTAAASVTAQLTAAGDTSTDVEVVTNLNVTGRPAQFGRGVMQDVSDKLLAQFASCLENKLGTPDEAPESPSTAAGGATTTVGSADTAEAPVSGVTAAAVASDPAGIEEATPIARQAKAATESTTQARRPRAPVEAAELDFGAAVLPVLVRRYAPYLVGGVIVVWLLRKMFRRS